MATKTLLNSLVTFWLQIESEKWLPKFANSYVLITNRIWKVFKLYNVSLSLLFLNHCGIILKYGGGSVNRCVVVVICFSFLFLLSFFFQTVAPKWLVILWSADAKHKKWIFFKLFTLEVSCAVLSLFLPLVAIHNRLQCRAFLGFCAGHKTARIASSNTCLRPLWVNAEHSRYLTAPTSLAIDKPWKRMEAKGIE